MPYALAWPFAQSLVLHSAVDVCEFVDGLDGDAAGELLFEGRASAADGAVFVENGRVCWAAARGLARRLSDLLAAPAKLDAAAMENLYLSCKREHAPLGEYLVKAGWVTAPELRSALLLHTAESLHALCRPDAQASWTPRRPGGYSSQFTFTTTELLPRTFALSHAQLIERASLELEGAFEAGDWGAAFVRSPFRAAPDPIAIHGTLPDRIETLLRLGRWATSSLDVTSIAHDDNAFVAAVVEDRTLVAWRIGATIVAGKTSLQGPARILNRRARARRMGVTNGSV